MRVGTILLVAFTLGIAACSTERVCAPGSTQQCMCTDGAKGAQSCASDGEQWGACTCSKGAAAQGTAQVLTPDTPAAPNQPVVAQPGVASPSKPLAAPTTGVQPSSTGADTPVAQEPAGSPLGARCLVDRDCSSGECKGFKCITRTSVKAPLGASCVVDGDCASLECKGFQCVPRK